MSKTLPVRPCEWGVLKPLLALTILQPWASLIACGGKHIETRGWRTAYRGPLVIHAGISAVGERLFADDMFGTASRVDLPLSRPRGAIVAIARLIDCRPADEAPTSAEAAVGHYGRGRWGWHLEGVFGLPQPICTRGRLGLWEVVQPALGDLLRQWMTADGS